ncbi:MAG: UDP-N-acetylenolpyruvoylglucosamine reductase [Candidatus Veblenbacteria bacterium RIFOXYC2_FULL_42_11]|uniref:UDP-N-acetylenolpyruvoylglucosamine reductase n=2 Tax=Candidatus Vebleniibacteriota TaxID=1817921 RepID=A0A1G2Q572_9BACT|nr:MAG: UDP-N-acetylenolpyruvoylglucosamine reductase [Candidatus Veblenbacteria bacterium RIFOXYA2_FULL_43_9]OHA56467.1 MAG: UDP-N-acetylenolpyruvoylglucosamine reductase [Candidatus Veblenbacteria bacterium RIFOXYC2_FULL_42_11]HAO81631.1 UDP-N-acetylenolpyruvoylglucosamine reductase [Candidatus Veblenbacteria bacterium]
MAVTLAQLKENLGETVQTRVKLAPYTNFKIGGPAKFLFEAKTSEQLIKAVQVANEFKLPLLILGGASNVLVADKGYNGLVVLVRNNQWKIEGERVTAEAGVNLGFLVQQTVNKGLSGFEPLVAVPGTIGGAIFGNAGVPQVPKGFIGDWVESVTVCRDDKLILLNREECGFGYRQSAFKQTNDIILSAVFNLKIGSKEQSQELIKKYIAARKGQPYNKPSSGCIFMNVSITDEVDVRKKFAGEEKLDEFIKRGQLPSSWLIDKAGLKGKTIGGIQVSEDHANYLINIGGGTAEQVVQMISYIKQQVRDKFGFQLQEEVRYLGF